MKAKRMCLVFLGLLLAWVPRGAAQEQGPEQEEILSYFVTVDIGDGGRMDVTERIAVRALGKEIRRGIYRDFPTSFPRPDGVGRVTAPFDVTSVTRDGQPEPYTLESISGAGGLSGVRVRIGDPNHLLEKGNHAYIIHYRTSRWVDFGENRDRFYWNVTGNGWAFPIRRASVAVTLPGSVDPDSVQVESWTGPPGSTEDNAMNGWDDVSHAARAVALVPLAPHEGLTVRVTVPKGVIAPPTAEERKAWFRLDWGRWIDTATVLALVLALYLVMWSRVGRDPEAGTVVVRYEPPEGFSAPGLGYLAHRGWSDAVLTSAIVGMAVKGAVRIEQDGRDWTLHTTEGDGGAEGLSLEESILYGGLLGARRSLALKATNATEIRAAVKDFRRALSRRFERAYFVLNRGWFAAGLGLSLLGLGFLAWRDRFGIPAEGWFMSLWLTFWTLGTATLVYRVWTAWRQAARVGGAGAWSGALFLTLFSVPFVGAEIVVGGLLTTRLPQHILAAAVGVAVINVLFYHLLEAPTLRGRGVLDQLEGFKRFLTATDADRMDRMNPPDRTPELFERYLPYAIALGVENRWAESFTSVLASSAQAPSSRTGRAAFMPVWYSGGNVSDFSGLASSLGGSFSSSLSSASSPPSSGGSGGGGSSGGGGGGGGGGGW